MRSAMLILLAATTVAGCSRAETAAGTTNTVNRAADETPAASGKTAANAKDPAAVAVAARREWREVTIPAGTQLPIVLDTAVSSSTSQVEESVHGHTARAITVHGQAALPEGSRVSGVVTDATRSGKVKGRAHLALRFETLTPRGDDERYRIVTTAVGRTAPGTKKDDAVKIGAPAAGGALVGALIGGKKGALIGTAAGGGAGTAVVLSTRGKEVSLPRGSAFTIRLVEPVTVKVRG